MEGQTMNTNKNEEEKRRLKNIDYHLNRLIPGEIYWDKKNKKNVEYGYLGQTGFAIVYEPGDSGGGMQSSWGVDPDNLESIITQRSSN
jgi:hypothetical protein